MGEKKVKIVAVIDSETGKFKEGMTDVEGQTKRSASVMEGIWQGVGQSITRAILDTAKAALDKVVAGVKAVAGEFKTGVKDAAAFENALAKIGAKGVENLGGIRAGLLDVSNELGENLPEMVEAASEALRRGIPEDNLIDFIKTSSKLAGASGEELTTVVNGLANTITAYRLDASSAAEVADKFAVAQRSGKVAVGELSVAMGALAPIASELGVSYEEMIAVFETGTDRGMKMRNVMSAMQSMMENLLRPTGETAQALEGMGLSAESAGKMIAEGGLVKFLTQVGPENLEKLAGSASELSLMLAILGQDAGASFNEALGNLQASAGAVDQAFETVENTTTERWNDLFFRFRNMMMEIGAPVNEYLGDMLEVINENLTSRFPEIGAKLKEVISRFIAGGVSDEEEAAINQAVAEGKMTAEEGMAKIYAEGPGAKLIETIKIWCNDIADRVINDLDEALNGDMKFGDMIVNWIKDSISTIIPAVAPTLIKTGVEVGLAIGSGIVNGLMDALATVELPWWMMGGTLMDRAKILEDIVQIVSYPFDHLSVLFGGELPREEWPNFSQGGIVPGGYGGGDRVPAMLEPGEIVLPKETAGRMTNGELQMGNTININIEGYNKDPRELAREIQRVLRDEERLGRGLGRLGPEFGV